MKRNTYIEAALLVVLSGIAWGQGAVDSSKNDTVQNRGAMAKMHRQMADAHTKIADCLSSDRPISECQQQMTTMCSTMQGTMGNMHGMMGGNGMHGMMGGMTGCPMMNGTQAPASPEKTQPKK